MSKRYEFTSSGDFTLALPGSTDDDSWDEPLSGWGLVLGDPWSTALVIEGSLEGIEQDLLDALAEVRRRRELEQCTDFIEVPVDECTYKVPRAHYREGMSPDEVQSIAVSVQEDC